MTRILFLTTASLLVAMHLPAQSHPWEHEQWRTKGAYNGRMWNDLTAVQKDFYLAGFVDASDAVGWYYETTNFFPYVRTIGEITKALDRFYDTPENVRITIADGLLVCQRRFVGTPEAEVQKLILRLRAEVDAPLPRTWEGYVRTHQDLRKDKQ